MDFDLGMLVIYHFVLVWGVWVEKGITYLLDTIK